MNAKKERELYLRSVERHLERVNRMRGEYRRLSEVVKDSPVGPLVGLDYSRKRGAQKHLVRHLERPQTALAGAEREGEQD